MAGLRVFISSTCYDLSQLRSQLRSFVLSMGYDPIMSDYEDILYDPRMHTHTSCVDEVGNCDILVLIIGARLGGKAVIESLNRINFDVLQNESLNIESLKEKGNLSVTQLEVLKAIESSIPVYTFIDKRVWHDHEVYEKNRKSEIIDKIIFPSIEKQETAKYIFSFINFIRLRTNNNNIFKFEKGQDIEEILRKQWSGYFQRLLNEERYAEIERKKIDVLGEQFEDLKTAILSSINNGDQREIARGVVRFRRMFDFLFSLKLLDYKFLKETNDSWEKVLKHAKVVEIIYGNIMSESYSRNNRSKTFFVLEDGTFFESRTSYEWTDELSLDWKDFITLKPTSREIIIDALADMPRGIGAIRYVRRGFQEFLQEQHISNNKEYIDEMSLRNEIL